MFRYKKLGHHYIGLVGLVVLFGTIPLVSQSPYYLGLLTTAGINAIAALGLHLLWGWGGK